MTSIDGAGLVPAPSLIVAQVGEDGAHDEVRRAAVELAEQAHASLVLYDADADSLLAEPMPSNWSADGADDEFDDLLSPDDLDVLGRPELSDMVAQARERGLDAHGWLAGGRGIHSITDYAERISADLVVVPDEALAGGPLDLDAEDVLDAARDIPSPVRIAVVRDDGSIDYRAD